jgi:hypothetical protein
MPLTPAAMTVQGIRPANAAPQRQWTTTLVAFGAVGLVGAAGYPARADRTGQRAAERPLRTHAQDTKIRDDTATGGEPAGAAAQVQPIPTGVQRRTTARSPGHGHSGLDLRVIEARDAESAAAAGSKMNTAAGSSRRVENVNVDATIAIPVAASGNPGLAA